MGVTMPAGYLGGPIQPITSTSEAQVVGQQPMLPGLQVMSAPLPSASPIFTEARAANEHSEHMLRNLLIGFDVFERYFQQMEKHANLMEANTDALTQHTQALLDLEKQLTDVRKSGLDAAKEGERVHEATLKKAKATAGAMSDAADHVERAATQTKAGTHRGRPRTARPGQPAQDPADEGQHEDLVPRPPQPTNLLDDYRQGGLPRVVATRLERHYANRIQRLGGDRLGELANKGVRTDAEEAEFQHLKSITEPSRRGVRVAQNVEEHGALGALKGEFPMIARGAGAVGIAMAAYQGVEKVGQMQAAQRERMAQFQQGTGGGQGNVVTRLWGGEQGFQERLFGFKNMFGMGDAQSRQLFEGVNALGIDDAQGRQSALNFATKAFHDTGMQVAQSLELIRSAAANGVQDFTKFGTAIDTVSKAARVGGLSVAEAQQMFAQNYAAVAPQVGGQAGIAVSTAITSGMAQLGQEVASNVSITGVATNPTALRRTASTMGMSYSQLVGQMMDPVSGSNFSLKVSQGNIDGLADAVIGKPGRAQLSQMVQRIMKSGATEQAAVQQVGSQALENGLINIDRLMALAPYYGVQSQDPSAIVQWIIQASIGGINVGPGAQPKGAETTQMPGGLGKVLRAGSGQEVLDMGMRGGASLANLQVHPRMARQELAIAGKLGYTDGKTRGFTDLSMYQNLVETTGKRDPVLEALLAKGVYDHNTRFRVQTADGQRDVSLGIAMHHYLDQLHAGTAEIVSGSHKNQTVAALTGIVDTTFKGANVATKRSSASMAPPDSKYVGKPKDGAGGTVIIQPSPELQRILRFYPSGGAYIDNGRQSGMPSPAFAPQGDRPTAGSG